jgi:membrane protease subunit HflC
MRSRIAVIIAAVIAVAGLMSLFIVDEREKVLVLRFGQIKQVKTDPGLGLSFLGWIKLSALMTGFCLWKPR